MVIDWASAVVYRGLDGWGRAAEYAAVLGHVEDAGEVLVARWSGGCGECGPSAWPFDPEAVGK